MKKQIIILALLITGLSSCVNRFDAGSLHGNKQIITSAAVSQRPAVNHTYYYELRGAIGLRGFYSDSVYRIGDTLTIGK